MCFQPHRTPKRTKPSPPRPHRAIRAVSDRHALRRPRNRGHRTDPCPTARSGGAQATARSPALRGRWTPLVMDDHPPGARWPDAAPRARSPQRERLVVRLPKRLERSNRENSSSTLPPPRGEVGLETAQRLEARCSVEGALAKDAFGAEHFPAGVADTLSRFQRPQPGQDMASWKTMS